jgi:hypothetical protein
MFANDFALPVIGISSVWNPKRIKQGKRKGKKE